MLDSIAVDNRQEVPIIRNRKGVIVKVEVTISDKMGNIHSCAHQPQDGQHPLLRPARQPPEQSRLQQLSGQGYRQLQVGQHLLLQQAGRPPEADHHDDGDKYDNFGLDISCRNKYEQMSSVLEGGGASLVAQSRLHGKPNIVCCRVSVRFSTWAEVHARTDTLVRQPPYLVTRGWEEVVPWGD